MSSLTDPQLEQVVLRIAQRAAEAVPVATVAANLALAQESLDAQAAQNRQLQERVTQLEAELARAHQAAEQLRQRLLTAETPDDDVDRAAAEDEAGP